MMNEGCEEKDSLVRVRAQVMTRDDSSGGWVPMDGGGLSNVSVRKRVLHHHHHHTVVTTSVACNNNPASRSSSTSGPGPPPTGIINTNNHPLMCHCGNNIIQQHEFLILGKRISDQTVVLSCTIRKDFQYNKVMPTFHHWRTGDQKFGLTFQTAADARAFDKGVRMAVEDLLDAFLILPGFRHGLADLTPALHHMNSDVSEDDVFMTLDLPMERSELQQTSSPTSNNQNSTTTNVTTTSTAVLPLTSTPPLLSKEPHLHRIHFMQRRPLPPSSSTSSLPLLNNSFEGDNKEQSISPEQLMWQQRDQELALARERERAAKEKERQRRERENSIWSGVVGLNDHIELDKESYSYVQFAREGGGIELHSLHSLHEYSYPVMPDPAASKPSSQGTTTTTTSISTSLTTTSARRDSLSSLKKNPIPSVSSCNTTSSLSTAPMLPSKAGRGNNKKKRRGSNSSSSSTKMTISHLHTPVGAKGTGRLRCKHCQDTYQPEENRRGACNFAPDNVRSAIDAVSCVGCAQCLLYHCYADAEGDFAPHPCGCGGGSEVVVRRHQQHPHQGCCMDSSPKRWFGLALLSLVVPCLWCYLPLRACYRCGVQCGCCGKPHEPA